jgi:hypothetical protein
MQEIFPHRGPPAMREGDDVPCRQISAKIFVGLRTNLTNAPPWKSDGLCCRDSLNPRTASPACLYDRAPQLGRSNR